MEGGAIKLSALQQAFIQQGSGWAVSLGRGLTPVVGGEDGNNDGCGGDGGDDDSYGDGGTVDCGMLLLVVLVV
jgi:hypothetical protein